MDNALLQEIVERVLAQLGELPEAGTAQKESKRRRSPPVRRESVIDEKIPARVLSIRVIANASPMLLRALRVERSMRSLGLMTADSDDPSYVALDEATKKANVRVAYARSMYAGALNASTRLAGEFLGILAGETPEDVRSGLAAAVSCIENDAAFRKADKNGEIVYFAHCIARCGSYRICKVTVNGQGFGFHPGSP